MKITAYTTTIHIPTVLARYREIGPDVEIIVAGDVSGPQDEIAAFCEGIGARYLGPQEQEALGPASSPIVGFRSIQRRNYALLAAIQSGADVLLSVDTDNEPCVPDYFGELRETFGVTTTLTTESDNGWFNIGDYAGDDYIVRGYPLSLWQDGRDNRTGGMGGPIGVFSSLIFGDPDIGAIERLRLAPQVTDYVVGMEVINPRDTWAPVNSQCTAWRRELAPLAFVLPGVGRYDDIWAGLIAQRVLEATDYCVAFGFPAVRQDRHAHDLLADLAAEMHGMRHTETFVALLKEARVCSNASVLDNLAGVVDYLRLAAPDEVLPQQTKRFLAAWLEDVTAVLACPV